jgi:hypothetical protein
MQLARRIVAADPRMFGRGPKRLFEAKPAASGISADLKLFATTFVAGFVFVSILIAEGDELSRRRGGASTRARPR